MSVRLLILAAFLGLTATDVQSRESPPVVAAAIAACEAKPFAISGDIVCLRQTITPEIAASIEAHQGPIKAIVLDTPGGDMAASLRIGRRLFRDKAEIIVDGECSSSCGNYLAPLGHRKLHVTEGSFISLHGVPPRGLFDYIDARRKAAGKTVEELMSDTETFFAYQRAYPDHVRDVLIPEVQYFADVNKDEAYATRFAEVMRTLSMRPDYSCAPDGPTLLIVGPQWMARFRVNSSNVWWENDRRALIERLPASLRTEILIVDGDEHPSWIPGRGFVTPADCATAPSPASKPETLIF